MAFSWKEIKRRSVAKVAIAYVVTGWLVLQLTDVLISLLSLQPWIGRAVVALIAVGFIPAIIFSWVYEVTPDGLKSQREVDQVKSITTSTGKKLDRAIIAVLSIAVVIFAIDEFVWDTTRSDENTSQDAEQTIAVLPFVNMSSDPEQEYFSDGLTEELLNLLARVPALRVTSRTSVFFYKDKDFQIADVGRELGVSNILEGSVRQSGENIRITAQLIDVASDTHIWSETWDRTFENIFEIQDEIANSVVDELKIQLLGDVPQAYSTSPDAYSLYLQGVALASQFTADGNIQAERVLLRALELDREFVPTWHRLALNYISGSSGGAWHPDEAFPKARNAAQEMLKIDNENAAAHAILARIARYYEYDSAIAAQELRTAMELAPNEIYVLRTAAGFARFDGEFDRSIELGTEISKLDPLSYGPKLSLGYSYLGKRRFEEARNSFKEILDLAPVASQVHFRVGSTYLASGELGLALESMDRERRDGFRLAGRTMVFHAMEDYEAAESELEKLTSLGERWTYEIAQANAFVGNIDQAFDWMERAVARSDQSLTLIQADPFIENIRHDSRYEDLLGRLGVN